MSNRRVGTRLPLPEPGEGRGEGRTLDDLLALDRAHVWHPYTATEPARDPVVIVGARGATLVTADGRRLLDGNASWWVSTFGHRHPRLVRALVRQARRLDHCALAGLTHEPAVRLAHEVVAIAPRAESQEPLTRVFFSDDGSTAVEAAVKIAVQHHRQRGEPGRTRFLALGGAFHGDTMAGTSLGGVEAFRAAFSAITFRVWHAPDADRDAMGASDDDAAGWARAFDALIAELDAHGADVAAVIVEPVLQGAAGMRVYAADHLRRLREATRRAGALLIADEVFTGYGRTGAVWACEHAGIVPDLLCTGKGFSGGMLPMAATLATERVFDAFRGGRDRAFLHGHSFTGNPLGAAVAREAIALLRDEQIIERVRGCEPLLQDFVRAMSSHPAVRRVRTIGMVAALDLGDEGYGGSVGWRVYERALERGIYLRPLGDTVYLAPPLTIRRSQLERMLGVIGELVVG